MCGVDNALQLALQVSPGEEKYMVSSSQQDLKIESTRVHFPVFERVSHPVISLQDVKTRRFSLIDNHTLITKRSKWNSIR